MKQPDSYTVLIAELHELVLFLRSYGEQYWSTWLDEGQELVEKGDPRGLSKILSAFGGMGSLNDLFIQTKHKHALSEHEIELANKQLNMLCHHVHEYANALQRKLDTIGD